MGLLCVLGELLVRLTAVKQKTSSDAETVSMSNDIVTTKDRWHQMDRFN